MVVHHVHLCHVRYNLRIILNVLLSLISRCSIFATVLVSYSAIDCHHLFGGRCLFIILLEGILLVALLCEGALSLGVHCSRFYHRSILSQIVLLELIKEQLSRLGRLEHRIGSIHDHTTKVD